MRNFIVVMIVLAVSGASQSLPAQTNEELAAMESRLMAKLERRIAEEGTETKGQIDALRISFKQAVEALAKSSSDLDRKALVAIDKGATSDGIAVLEERAKARDSAAAQNAALVTVEAREKENKNRAEEWKRIGALAFLDNTERAISAYQQAMKFAPDDASILNQLGELYLRQAQWSDRIAVGERLTHLKDPEAQAEGYYNIADSYLEQGDPERARKEAERGLSVARSANVKRLESRCLSLLAGANAQEGKFAPADEFAAQALKVAQTGGYTYERIMALFTLAGIGEGKVRMMPMNQRAAALEDVDRQYSEVEGALLKIEDPVAAANVLVNRAGVSLAKGDAALAEARLRTALLRLESAGATARLGYVEAKLGTALVAGKRFDEAIPYFKSSVQRAQQAKDPGREAVALIAWAQAEAMRSNNAEACLLAKEAYEVSVRGVHLEAARKYTEQLVKRLCH
jgi:tetratricopeptide (TPR) repeat protein